MQNRWATVLVSGLTCAGLLLAFSTTSSTQGSVYFRADFEDPGGSGQYNFAYKFPQSQWTHTHLSSGGWNGSGGAQIRQHAGQTQYQFGFATPGFNHTFTMGEAVYIRYRVKFLDVMRATNDWGNKFLMMGTTGTSPNSRIIIYSNPQQGSRGCTLGWSGRPEAQPDYFGLSASPNSFFTGAVNGVALAPHVFSFSAHVNIGWTCAGPALVTYPSSPFRATRPGAAGRGAPTTDGWYHVQVMARSGTPAAFRIWVNNNAESAPTSTGPMVQQEGLGVSGWSSGAHIGGFMDNGTPSTDLGYVVDDLEIAGGFDPNWYPGASGSPPLTPPPPSGPTNVRIIR